MLGHFAINVLDRSTIQTFLVCAVVAMATGCTSAVPEFPSARATSQPLIDPGRAVTVRVVTVRAITVRATGCGLADRIAAGFPVGPSRTVTAAHTLRGTTAISVDGTLAKLVWIDHRTDIAILEYPTDGDAVRFAKPSLGRGVLIRRARSAASAESGSAGSGSAGSVRAAPLGLVVSKVAQINIEEPVDHTTYHRKGFVAALGSGTVSVGDSGSPVVNNEGAIIGMVFATDTASSQTVYGVSSSEIIPALKAAGSAAVSSGQCLD